MGEIGSHAPLWGGGSGHDHPQGVVATGYSDHIFATPCSRE